MTKRYKVIRDDGEYSSYWDTLEAQNVLIIVVG